MNGEHKRSSADVMVTQATLIKRLFILSVTGLMLMCGGYFPGMSVYAQNTTSSNARHAKKISGVVIDSNGELSSERQYWYKAQVWVLQRMLTESSRWIFRRMEKCLLYLI